MSTLDKDVWMGVVQLFQVSSNFIFIEFFLFNLKSHSLILRWNKISYSVNELEDGFKTGIEDKQNL